MIANIALKEIAMIYGMRGNRENKTVLVLVEAKDFPTARSIARDAGYTALGIILGPYDQVHMHMLAASSEAQAEEGKL